MTGEAAIGLCCSGVRRTWDDHCTGWVAAGYPWHGCKLKPRHQGHHVCKCGDEWPKRRGYEDDYEDLITDYLPPTPATPTPTPTQEERL